MTPEERLCSRSWRWSNSLWMLTSLLSVGFLGWTGFVYIGSSARRRAWLIGAALWFLYFVGLVVLLVTVPAGTKDNPVRSVGSTLAGFYLVAGYIGQIVHQAIANRGWLRWRSEHPRGSAYTPDASIGKPPGPADATTMAAQADRELRSALGGASLLPATPTKAVAPAGRVASAQGHPPATNQDRRLDINAASPQDLVDSFDLQPEMADLIATTRVRIGGFTSADQLMTAAGLPPHLFLGVKDRIVVGPAPALRWQSARGRRLDL